MLAARMDLDSGEVHVREVPRPRPAAGQLLIRVAGAVIGSVDRDILARRLPRQKAGAAETTVGHEVAGRVSAPGAGVDGWPLGQSVVVHPLRAGPDGTRVLGLDRDGGWAEYLVARAAEVVAVPDSLDVVHAAAAASSVTAVWAALTRSARLVPGESVVICGQDARAVMAARIARLLGAAPIVLVTGPGRTADADLGADIVIDLAIDGVAESIPAAIGGIGINVALVLDTGSATAVEVGRILADGGRLLTIGRPLPPDLLDSTLRRLTLTTHVIRHFGSTVSELRTVLDLMGMGRIGGLVPTRAVTLVEAAELARAAPGEVVSVLPWASRSAEPPLDQG
jgi:D-arabinose 1-dehydrogenase-like Zn-dependent alcohol dehydrogenase